MTDKASGAFLTIGELAEELELPQHILRYWETRFTQLRPLQRAGKRRYYRPEDVALVRHIHRLLNQEGYTIRGVQKLLSGKADEAATAPVATAPVPTAASPAIALAQPPSIAPPSIAMIRELKRLRAELAEALARA